MINGPFSVPTVCRFFSKMQSELWQSLFKNMVQDPIVGTSTPQTKLAVEQDWIRNCLIQFASANHIVCQFMVKIMSWLAFCVGRESILQQVMGVARPFSNLKNVMNYQPSHISFKCGYPIKKSAHIRPHTLTYVGFYQKQYSYANTYS